MPRQDLSQYLLKNMLVLQGQRRLMGWPSQHSLGVLASSHTPRVSLGREIDTSNLPDTLAVSKTPCPMTSELGGDCRGAEHRASWSGSERQQKDRDFRALPGIFTWWLPRDLSYLGQTGVFQGTKSSHFIPQKFCHVLPAGCRVQGSQL